MVKFTYEDGSGQCNLGLGISRENVNKIIEGLPIVVKLKDLGGKTINGNILIYFGETAKDCVDQVQEFITPDTVIHKEGVGEG
jgi:hypothetical protein